MAVLIKENGQLKTLSMNLKTLSPKTETTKTVALDMVDGNQVVTPEQGETLSVVTIEKPSTLTPENIKKDVNIGGVVGTMASGLDTSQITNFNEFGLRNRITAQLEKIDTSNGTNFTNMFGQCSSSFAAQGVYLTVVSTLNTSKGRYFTNMFNSCLNLKEVRNLDTSNGTDFERMFYDCRSLEADPNINTSKGEYFSEIFQSSNGAIPIPLKTLHLDLTSARSCTNAFRGLHIIEEIRLDSIKVNVDLSYCPLLTVESIVYCCSQCIRQSSTKTLTIGTTNRNKIANVYVKFTNPSQTTIAVGEKGEVVQCESTDTGAMTLANYMSLKSWSLA